MKLELRFGGLLVTAAEGDRFHLQTEPGATTSVAELYAIAQFLEALSRAHAAKAPELARAASSATASADVRWTSREPDGHGQVVPARTGAASYVPAQPAAGDHKVLPETAAASAQVVPRAATVALPATPAAAPSVALAAPAGEVKKPGRPIGGPQPRQEGSPGRPRTTPLAAAATIPATATEAATAASAAAPSQPHKPALPGRPRTHPVGAVSAPSAAPAAPLAAAEPPVAAAKPVTKVPAQPAPKVRTGRLVDQLDGWMKANPGPRNRDELIQVSIDAGWLNADDAKRVFNMCMSRERELFIRSVDGNNEMYIRRAEALAPSSAPGKVVRRRPSEGGPGSGGLAS